MVEFLVLKPEGHICPCKFKSIAEAVNDLEKYVEKGKIISYKVKKFEDEKD